MNFRDVLLNIKKETALYMNNITAYIKYQLLTKAILFFLLPLFYKAWEILIKSSGEVVISSGNYKAFLTSLPAICFLTVSLIVFLLCVVMDINAFITISASIKKTGKPGKLTHTLKNAIKSTKSFFSPAGAFLALYTALIVPLVGVGTKASLIQSLNVPNFITSVIYGNTMYLCIYLTVLGVLAAAGFFLIFSFHFMYLHNNGAMEAIKNSVRTVWNNKYKILMSFVLLNVILAVLTVAVLLGMYFAIEALDILLVRKAFFSRFTMVLMLFLFVELMNICLFLMWPLQLHMLTSRFCALTNIDKIKCNFESPKSHKVKGKKIKGKLAAAIIALMIFNIAVSGLAAVYFDDLFHYNPKVDIIAHRGGGDLAAENTLLGVNAAAEAGAQWSEIDVMRSKDGIYVINHDATFERLTGVSKAPSEMTWDEIRSLEVKDAFVPGRQSDAVPDLSGIMDAAKGRIGLLIELKKPDADEKMADDVVESIISRGMEKETMVISLDYNIIKYIEQKYPGIKTGYLYFFAVGDTSKIATDCLLMEESAINADVIEKIHNEGKLAFAWTVNDSEAIKGLFDAGIDGIITDHVVELKEAIQEMDQKTDKELILDELKSLLTND